MDSIAVIFTMLIAILTSGAISRVLPINVPLPLIQIALGMLIAGVFQEGITIQPEVFFFMFLPPLLFLDGWRIPKDALQNNKLAIFQLAFGLVILTVFGLGLLINWMIPALPLAVSFALAAILSPTDPVAVSGIARKLAIPSRIMTILEGEALFNDASGLVAFRIAVLAAVTGTFSFYNALGSFLWVALAGILVGVVITWTLSFIRTNFTARYGEETGSEILISLLTPFAAYVAAEQIGASGILSAVAAGITMSRLELSGLVSPLTRMRRSAIWDTVQFTLNGIMFVLLGEQLPAIFEGAIQVVKQTGHHNPWWLIIYATVICLALAGLRFIWVFITLNLLRVFHKGSYNHYKEARLTEILIVSFGGVRGAVTLAGVLTLPLLMPDKTVFPGRDLAIFLAATTIILSLVTASIVLPWLLKSIKSTNALAKASIAKQTEFAIYTAQQAASKHVYTQLKQIISKNPALDEQQLQQRLDTLLQDFLVSFGNLSIQNTAAQELINIERHLRLEILSSARQTIYHLARDKKISDEVARDIVKQLDYDEIRYN